jgi:hypothetical protein
MLTRDRFLFRNFNPRRTLERPRARPDGYVRAFDFERAN